jgi:DNA-binding transcriptional LysR family regulator
MNLDLNDVFVFSEVVEAGSFSGAAQRVGLPASTVSRRVARLERLLGLRLLARTTRKLSLTEAGRTYFQGVRVAVGELKSAEDSVRALQAVPRGPVRVTTAAGMAPAVWAEMAAYLRAYSEVTVQLEISEGFTDMVGEGFDLAIRGGILPDSELVARKIASARGELFASDSYLAGAGPLESVADLSAHDCVCIGGHVEGSVWKLFEGSRERSVSVRGRVNVSELQLAVQAAADGFGIVLAPPRVVEALVGPKGMTRVLPNVHAGVGAVWLVSPSRGKMTAAVRGLAEHLVQYLPQHMAAEVS